MHKPTEESKELVDRWVRNGIPRLLIAESLNISYTTLMKHYRNEIKTAEANAVIEVPIICIKWLLLLLVLIAVVFPIK